MSDRIAESVCMLGPGLLEPRAECSGLFASAAEDIKSCSHPRRRLPGLWPETRVRRCQRLSQLGPWQPHSAADPGSASAAASRLTCRIDSRTACAAALACSVRPLISLTACLSDAVRATRSRYLSFRFEIRSASCQSRNADLAASTSAAERS